ncbi:MAG: ATP-binding cassette domain-containing protein [Lentisphaerae bacterium]|jgi:phospholipid/cholesterol/gamma-HCH transport system ATP-binding protein|nr:ATP-binding cassette domain-containing protein [Lentisphaerota bacterium]MBT4822032.1 ATP-binding cassette domain-containing protein [Lentisphaerota bacterium]MBT5609900.1 ATP-binding cassette domain-containing protein [Lentisphaerota bacterium]MBT7061421.1 ATP-binding cassette domain-containing protein [Lentisphaerota bacterium]MBT7847499.1 ATP-binding cassette domain-containing protein [Lentisphaerota bacterium]
MCSESSQPNQPDGDREPVIEVDSFVAKYGDTVVLTDVTFSVMHSEIFGILGGSGCGKSTILKHLIGLKAPASGLVRVLGTDLGKASESERLDLSRRFGVLFQNGALFGALTVGENIALPLQEFTDLPTDAVADIVRRKLELVGLAGSETRYPSELSGGMRKRAGLARAMALDPELLFFDEPSSGLDPVLAADLDRLILKLRDTFGTTMVIVTHDLDSTLSVTDRVILVDREAQGIIATGNAGDLAERADLEDVHTFFNRAGLRTGPPGHRSTTRAQDE